MALACGSVCATIHRWRLDRSAAGHGWGSAGFWAGSGGVAAGCGPAAGRTSGVYRSDVEVFVPLTGDERSVSRVGW